MTGTSGSMQTENRRAFLQSRECSSSLKARQRKKRPRRAPKHFEHNQAVEKLLEEKGFVMTDKAHGSAIVNRFLQTHPEAHD